MPSPVRKSAMSGLEEAYTFLPAPLPKGEATAPDVYKHPLMIIGAQERPAPRPSPTPSSLPDVTSMPLPLAWVSLAHVDGVLLPSEVLGQVDLALRMGTSD